MSNKHTKIFNTPRPCRCDYDENKPLKTAIGKHGRIFLFDDGTFGQSTSWSILVGKPYDKFSKPPVKIGQVLKSTNGSIEGMVNLIRRTVHGYIVLVGNMEFTNSQLCDMFGIVKKENIDDIECIKLPHYEKGL